MKKNRYRINHVNGEYIIEELLYMGGVIDRSMWINSGYSHKDKSQAIDHVNKLMAVATEKEKPENNTGVIWDSEKDYNNDK